ncbi:hypothetical protein HELRODRAFT_90783, partial [Helobdella robusta]|uniref:Protein RFT1 homolog n=1 Tax=Helobdella robusta TaxID=6412 RepID=T1G7W3_HELRO
FLQLIFRAVTFTMNVVIIRFLSRDILGVVNVRLMLLYNTVFILTSEPFTRACLKNIDSPTNEDLKRWSSVINLLWGCFPVGLLWAVFCSVIWLTCLDWPDNSITSSYSSAVILYALSAVIELLSEPIKIVTQILLLVKIKPIVEGLSLAVETSVLVISVLYWPQVGLFAFCMSKLSYSCSVTISYYTYILYKIYKNTKCRCITNNNLYAKNIENDHKLTNINNNSTTKLLWSFSRHVILKQVFTEGEKYIMTLFGVLSFADQGVYSVVNNLGSLVVRILFLPMEESFYLFMSQTVKRGHVSFADINDSGTSINLVATTYENVLRVRTLLGLTIATFGFSCSYLALQIFFGEKLSAPPGLTLLRWNCVYMLLVSINGITEGFLNASMDHKQVDRYNHAMLMFSVAFLLTSWFFTSYLSLGAVGFCLSNCCNMIFRIIYSLQQANRYFARTGYNPIKGLLLTGPVIGSYLFSFIVCTMSEVSFIF